MSQADKSLINQSIEKANHDLLNASMIIESNPIILDIACFHCQQAVEKFLKTFLLFKGQDLIKTHNLDILLKRCIALDSDFMCFDFINLEDYAVRARYPDNYLAPELAETQEYYRMALQVKELVLRKI